MPLFFQEKGRISSGAGPDGFVGNLIREIGSSPSSSATLLRSSPNHSLSSLGIQTRRPRPPSALMNFLLITKARPWPINPGVCTPPPTEPAKCREVHSAGSHRRARGVVIITPLTSGTIPIIHSKQPQEVIGRSIKDYMEHSSTDRLVLLYTNSLTDSQITLPHL